MTVQPLATTVADMPSAGNGVASGVPALLSKDGEVVELVLGPMTTEAACRQLPQIREALAAIRRYEGYLVDLIAQEMQARGQTERRAGDLVIEYKAESAWEIKDEPALWTLLQDACAKDEITQNELNEAIQQQLTFRANHTRLNALSKRIPEINGLRERVTGTPRLRIKEAGR